jgi:broad specificity phosphatase PhoE
VTGTSLRLVAAAPTPAMRRAVFGGDDDLDEGGRRAALGLAGGPEGPGPLGRLDAGRVDVLSGPARAAVQTARAAGREPVVDAALADCRYGRWDGRALAQVVDAEPDAVQAWLGDPAAAPHGGESFQDVLDRVAGWLDARAGEQRRIVAVTHAMVIRAALVHAIGVPAAAFRRLDVAPLSVTRLRARGSGWTLHLPPVDR